MKKNAFIAFAALAMGSFFISMAKADTVPGIVVNPFRVPQSSGTIRDFHVSTITFSDGSQQTTAATGGGGGGGGSGSTRYESNGTFVVNSTTFNALAPIALSSSSGKAFLSVDTTTSSGLITNSSATATYLTKSSASATYFPYTAPTTSNIPEGSNLYFTTARSTTAVSASAPLIYANGVFGVDGTSVTLQGNAFNGSNQLLKLNGSGALPSVSGANLTALPAANLTGTVPNSALDTSSITKQGNAGLYSGSPTTSNLPEGSNLYFTTARSTTSTAANSPLSNLNGVLTLGNDLPGGATSYVGATAQYVSSVTANSPLIAATSGTAGSTVTISMTNNLPGGSTSYIGATALYISSITTDASLTSSFSGTSGATVTIKVNVSSVSLPNNGVAAGSYTNTNLTVDSHGLITAASNGSSGGGGGLVSLSTGVTGTLSLSTQTNGRLPTANQSFSYVLQPLSAKFLSPGTTNFPKVDNSTTTGVGSLYWDSASTQAVTWATVLAPYGGGNLNVSFNFSGSSITTGNVNWSVAFNCAGATHSVSVDNLFQGYSVAGSTAAAVPATAGNPGRLVISGLTPTGCVEGDLIGVLMTRNHNVSSDALGDVRSFAGRIHEN